MKLFLLVLLTLSFAPFVAFADAPSAPELLTAAQVRAKAEQKAIFVHFGASWDALSQQFNAFLQRPEVKPVFERYFVPVELVVQEDPQHKALENSGANDVLRDLGGPQGLPYSAFLDPQCILIANSKRPFLSQPGGINIGFPSEPEEVDWFVQMMKKAAPKMSEAEIKIIETALRNSKK